MLHEIAKILNTPFNDTNEKFLFFLRRIERKLPLVVDINFRNWRFRKLVINAMMLVSKEGAMDLPPLVEEPVEHVYKIKRVKKGPRLQTIAPNGIRYSFGPKWNESVMSGSGIAFSPIYRPKLEYQASLAGITGVEEMSTKELTEYVSETLVEDII